MRTLFRESAWKLATQKKCAKGGMKKEVEEARPHRIGFDSKTFLNARF